MNSCKWKQTPDREKGVIVGCDIQQEWLLPWWWERYSEENNFPVLFVDFGMSQEARCWCEQRGNTISIDVDFSLSSTTYLRNCANTWKIFYESSSLPHLRNQWFKKPFACLASPFHRSVWIDLDCEVLQSIDPLFQQCNNADTIALVREYEDQHLPKLHPLVRYNGGVIAFNYGAEIIQQWAEDSIYRKDHFFGDDVLLSTLIFERKYAVCELPEIYNWKFVWGLNINAVIYHWLFAKGKEFIKNQGGIKHLIKDFQKTRGPL